MDETFNKAVHAANNFESTPSFDDYRELYGLYRQAVDGDNKTPTPSFRELEKYADWNAWLRKKGMNHRDAKLAYSKKVLNCIYKYGIAVK